MMDLNLNDLANGPNRLRQGGFQAISIAQFNRHCPGSRSLPLNSPLIMVGLFNIFRQKDQSVSLTITPECVLYILGRDEQIGKLKRSEIKEKLKDLSEIENRFLAEISHEIWLIFDKVFSREEQIRAMEHVSAGRTLMVRKLEAAVELPMPTNEHMDYVIERTAEMLKGKSFYIVVQVLRRLELSLG